MYYTQLYVCNFSAVCLILTLFFTEIHLKGEDGITALHQVAKFKPKKEFKQEEDTEDETVCLF